MRMVIAVAAGLLIPGLVHSADKEDFFNGFTKSLRAPNAKSGGRTIGLVSRCHVEYAWNLDNTVDVIVYRNFLPKRTRRISLDFSGSNVTNSGSSRSFHSSVKSSYTVAGIEIPTSETVDVTLSKNGNITYFGWDYWTGNLKTGFSHEHIHCW